MEAHVVKCDAFLADQAQVIGGLTSAKHMAPSSLKKMSGSKGGQEGNYASSNTLKQGWSIDDDLGLTLLPGLQIHQDEEKSYTAAGFGAANIQKHASNQAIQRLSEVQEMDMQTNHIVSAEQDASDPKGRSCTLCGPRTREVISRVKANASDVLPPGHLSGSHDDVQSAAVSPKAPQGLVLVLGKIEEQITARDHDGWRSEEPESMKRDMRAERNPGAPKKSESIYQSDIAVEQATRRPISSITCVDSDQGLLEKCLQRECLKCSEMQNFGGGFGDQDAGEPSVGDVREDSAVRASLSGNSGPDTCVVASCSSLVHINAPLRHERRSQTLPVTSTLTEEHQSLDTTAMAPNSRLCTDLGPGIDIICSVTGRKVSRRTKKGLKSWTGHYPSTFKKGAKTVRASRDSLFEDVELFFNSFGKNRQPLSIIQVSSETCLSRRRAASLPNTRPAHWGSIMAFPEGHGPPEQHKRGLLTPSSERSSPQNNSPLSNSFPQRERFSVGPRPGGPEFGPTNSLGLLQPRLAARNAGALSPFCVPSRSSNNQQQSIPLSNEHRNSINIWGTKNAPVAINNHTGAVQQALHNSHSMNTAHTQNPMMPPTFDQHQVHGDLSFDIAAATQPSPPTFSLRSYYDHLNNENSLLLRDREYLLNQNRSIIQQEEGRLAYQAQLKRQNAEMALKCKSIEKQLFTTDRDLAQRKEELIRLKDLKESLRIENTKLRIMNIEIAEKLSKLTAGTRSNEEIAQDILRSQSSLVPVMFNGKSSLSSQYETDNHVAPRSSAIAADTNQQFAYPDAILHPPFSTMVIPAIGEFQSPAADAWDLNQVTSADAQRHDPSGLSDQLVIQTANPSQMTEFTEAPHFSGNYDLATISPHLISKSDFTLPDTSASLGRITIDLTTNEPIPALRSQVQSPLSEASKGNLQTEESQTTTTASSKNREVSWLIGYHPGMTQAENTRRVQTMKNAEIKRKYIEPHPESVAPEPGARPTKKAKKTPSTKEKRTSPTAPLTAQEPSTPSKARKSIPMTRAESSARQRLTAERHRLKKKYEKELEKKIPRDTDEFKAAMKEYEEVHKVKWGSLKAAAMSPKANRTQDGTVVDDRSVDFTLFSDPSSSGSNDPFVEESNNGNSSESGLSCDPVTAGTSVSPIADPGLEDATAEELHLIWLSLDEEEKEGTRPHPIEPELVLEEESEESEEE